MDVGTNLPKQRMCGHALFVCKIHLGLARVQLCYQAVTLWQRLERFIVRYQRIAELFGIHCFITCLLLVLNTRQHLQDGEALLASHSLASAELSLRQLNAWACAVRRTALFAAAAMTHDAVSPDCDGCERHAPLTFTHGRRASPPPAFKAALARRSSPDETATHLRVKLY